ncbi:MAG TPA: copper resistance CopC family protein [Pseudonocardiaceae bacterium]|nr:copper resistance CopC family protein [Pseudonocardiaceae bacterium]
MAAVLATLTVTAGTASAQNALTFSDPSDGATLSSAPEAITLVFNDNLDPAHTRVTITGPHGAPSTGPAYIDGITASLRFDGGPNGLYTINYAVNSTEGTPFTGVLHFTLAVKPTANQNGAGAANAGPTTTFSMPMSTQPTAISGGPAVNAGHVTADQNNSTPLWPWLAIGGLAVAIVVVLFGRRRRRADEAASDSSTSE